MDSYWDLYISYINHCVEWNKKHDIDPHHYEMEWNHFLPKCIFGDQPLGQWLTLPQHAIASALQTLAFNKTCLFSTHKKYLPVALLELAWPIFCKRSGDNLRKTQASRTFEERQKYSRLANEARVEKTTPEQRKEISVTAYSEWISQSTPEERSAIQKANHQRKTPEEPSEIIRRGWETRKAKLKRNNNDFSS
jgi:hypothetical protein